jgi:hypothetical protein
MRHFGRVQRHSYGKRPIEDQIHSAPQSLERMVDSVNVRIRKHFSGFAYRPCVENEEAGAIRRLMARLHGFEDASILHLEP